MSKNLNKQAAKKAKREAKKKKEQAKKDQHRSKEGATKKRSIGHLAITIIVAVVAGLIIILNVA